jgi:hypothetical protein
MNVIKIFTTSMCIGLQGCTYVKVYQSKDLCGSISSLFRKFDYVSFSFNIRCIPHNAFFIKMINSSCQCLYVFILLLLICPSLKCHTCESYQFMLWLGIQLVIRILESHQVYINKNPTYIML